MKLVLLGYGKMGKALENAAQSGGHQVLGKFTREVFPSKEIISECDAIIDFSSASMTLEYLKMAVNAKKALVIGTTGWEKDLDLAKTIVNESSTAAIYAPNFSLGAALFIRLLEKARSLFRDYEAAGVEYHHNQKKDAPSGTAKTISEKLNMKTFASVRCGSITGKHEVIFDGSYDRIQMIHEAKDRMVFAYGAIEAAKWIINQNGWKTLDDMLGSLYGIDHAL